MDIKIFGIENGSNSEQICTEKKTCRLEENDIQCGYVFFNDLTRLLKYNCTYCEETYDNIELFCEHLSSHIDEYSVEIYNEIATRFPIKEETGKVSIVDLKSREELPLNLLKSNYELGVNYYSPSLRNDEDTRDAFECNRELENLELANQNSNSNQIVEYLNNEDMLIEEIEDSGELISGDEMHEQIDAPTNFSQQNTNREVIDPENINSTTVAKSIVTMDALKNGSSFEECFINETNINKIRSEGVCVLKEKNQNDPKLVVRKRPSIQDILRYKRRRKKVTTVKVIAVKNRIAELYEKIQSEQQKSQQFFSNDFSSAHHEQETQDAIESLKKDDEKVNTTEILKYPIDTENKSYQTTAEVSRKIIGETLITLIPEGTRIPDKMPSPVSTQTNTEFFNNDRLPFGNSINYQKDYKKEDNEEKIAVCPACGKVFRSHFSLTIHKRIHYLESDSSVKLAHKCSDCDQLFNKLSQLKHHVESVHYPDGFICKICNRQLSSLSLLERHMVKVHLGRPFNCNKCNKNFSDPVTFEEHLASHNSGEIFKCTTCGRKYSTEYFLLEHMRNHKEQVPQTCVVCGKTTLRITQHMKIHTPRPKRLLSCSECGKVFNFSSGLSHHFKIMHKLPRPPPKQKKEIQSNTYKCKRRSRNNERSINKRKQLPNSGSTESTIIIDSEKFSEQIIEEQIEISDELYATTTQTSQKHPERKEHYHVPQINLQSTSHTCISKSGSHDQTVIQDFHQDDIINHKEEEAKRVIVELIQNSAYTYFPEHFTNVLGEVTPPIAREETISAVNSIVHNC